MRTSIRMVRQDLVAPLRGEEGIALLTTLIIMLIMTVLGMGAVAVTAWENRIAGFQRTGESGTSAAESCVGASANIIQQTLANNSIPATFVSIDNVSSDGRPIRKDAETGANPTLTAEIMGQVANAADLVSGSGLSDGPDYYQLGINGYEVKGDIDFLYMSGKPGSGMQFAAGYEGVGSGTASGGSDYVYRIDCTATVTAVGAESRVEAIYACALNGQCQKKL